MKTASVTHAKNHLSALIAELGNGPVLILDRGRPVARLEAPHMAHGGDGQWESLVRRGLLRPGRNRLTKEFLNAPLARLPKGVSVVDMVLEERREGR